jgi:hypothetical protein
MNRSGQTQQFLDQAIGWIAWGLYNLVPNLQNFSLKDQILYLQPNDPPKDAMIPQLIMYGLVFAVSGYIISYIIFRRKEL